MDSCGKVVEICLVDRLELNFPHICNSLLVGDVDGDGSDEIVAGSRDGDLLVFKLTLSGRPYRKCSEPLGVISAMAIGDLFNSSRPTLTVICADGRLNAYQLADNSFETFSSSFVQLLMPNIRAAFIQDIDGDGQEELIVGLTDRVIRSYRYVHGATRDSSRLQALNKWELPAQMSCIAVVGDNHNFQLAVSQLAGQYVLITPKLTNCSADGTELTDTTNISRLQPAKTKLIEAAEDILFLFDSTTDVANFHHQTDLMAILPTTTNSAELNRVELIVTFPTPIFALSVIVGPEDIRLFCACDYIGNLYVVAVGRELKGSWHRPGRLLLHWHFHAAVLNFICAEVDSRSRVVFLCATQGNETLMGMTIAKEKLLSHFR